MGDLLFVGSSERSGVQPPEIVPRQSEERARAPRHFAGEDIHHLGQPEIPEVARVPFGAEIIPQLLFVVSLYKNRAQESRDPPP